MCGCLYVCKILSDFGVVKLTWYFTLKVLALLIRYQFTHCVLYIKLKFNQLEFSNFLMTHNNYISEIQPNLLKFRV